MGSEGPGLAAIAEWTRFESVSAFADNVRIVWQGRRALYLVMEVRGVTFGEALVHLVEQGTIIAAALDAAIVDLARYADILQEMGREHELR